MRWSPPVTLPVGGPTAPQTPDGWADGPLVLYHGTRRSAAEAVLAGVDLSRSRQALDFGPGFYTTTWAWQAWRWARERAAPGDPAAVIWFSVDRGLLSQLSGLSFVRASADAADFWLLIEHCRRQRGPHRPDGPQPL